MAVEIGVLPARYTDARAIAHGGMGTIYAAEDRELGRRVVVKVLSERFAGNRELRVRFKREALTAARLSGHPHVITIFDVGEWNGRPFIVMEFLPGGTLEDRARSGAVHPRDALAWLAQAAEALDDAHELGIVHRDVKPANLLFDTRGELVVADFGIARVADDTAHGMTAAGTVLGTAGYLAPEQALGEPATPASDRYALAIVAYELLTGRRPFERGSPTAEAAAHIHEPVPPASEQGAGLPPAVDTVFERALAKDQAGRYPSAAEFVADLETALAGREGTTRLLPAAGPPVVAGRSPWLPVLVAALLLALVGGVAAGVFATGDGSPAIATSREQVTITQKQVRTLSETTTVTAPPPPPAASGGGPPTVNEAVALTDQATFALRRGDWKEAEESARKAVRLLDGTYSDGFRYEAYANFDLGKALAELGHCRQSLRYLDRSGELQGHRSEIDAARSGCREKD